jgi:hypothetical protein
LVFQSRRLTLSVLMRPCQSCWNKNCHLAVRVTPTRIVVSTNEHNYFI